MQTMMNLAAIFLLLSLSACSSQQVSMQPAASMSQVSHSVAVIVKGESADISPEIIDKLGRRLKAGLIVAGFDIDNPSEKSIKLEVLVKEFNPGNAALRLTVGFGAGRGSLLYLASYYDPAGNILARLDGQERFTGLEPQFNTNYGAFATLGGEETATEVLLQEAAKHIVELANKN